MIALIREELLESDFSMCLALLMSYKNTDDPLTVIQKAEKVRNSFLYGQEYEVAVSESKLQHSPINEDYFEGHHSTSQSSKPLDDEFEQLDGDVTT
jgi:hypothetical protein